MKKKNTEIIFKDLKINFSNHLILKSKETEAREMSWYNTSSN